MPFPTVAVTFWDGSTLRDYATSCTSLVIERGKQKVLDRMTSATCVATFISTGTGELDPSTGIRPFGVDTFMVVEAENSATVDVTLFAGRVTSWKVAYPGPDFAAVTVTASGQFKQLADVDTTVVLTDDVEDVLDSVVATAFGAVADGTYVIYSDPFGGKIGTTVALNDSSDALSMCHSLTDTVGGDLVERMSNDRTHPVYQFIGRRRRYQAPVITFTDVTADIDPASNIFPYDESTYGSEITDDLLKNKSTITRNGGAAQSATDAVSRDITDGHGPRDHTLSSWHTTDAAALLEATRVVWESATSPTVAVQPVRLTPCIDESDELWDLILDVGIEYTSEDRLPLMRQVAVVRTTPFGTVTRNSILLRYRHEIFPVGEGEWTTTLFFADGHQLTGGDVTAFTAVVKQDGAVVASDTDDAYYVVRDGWCRAHLKETLTAAGTPDKEMKVTPTGLPAPATASAGERCGTVAWLDASASDSIDGSATFDGTDIRFQKFGATDTSLLLGRDPNLALASGDTVYVDIEYRVA